MAFALKLLGVASVVGDRGALTGPAVQRHRLALLALVAVSRSRSSSRDKLMAQLWPESDAEHARGLLNQAVHVLRRDLGHEAIRSVGDEMQLNAEVVSSDVAAFEAAVTAGELERAAALYAGPFLDGFFLSEAPEFEHWVERERDRLARLYAGVLEGLAQKAGSEQDPRRAVEWWKAKVDHDPYDSGAVLQLMQALAAAGNRAAALHEAEAHQRLLQEELGMEPSPDIRALAERMRTAPTASAPPLVFTPSTSSGSTLPGPAYSAEPAAPGLTRKRRILPYALGFILLAAVLGALWRGLRSSAPAPTAVVPGGSVDEIAKAVARELERRQHGDTATLSPPERTRSIAAYELYLKGSDPTLIRSDSGARRALEYFQHAVALDSNYAAAWAGLARLAGRASTRGDTAAMNRARAVTEHAAERAIALDYRLGEAHSSLALIRAAKFDLAGAEAEFRRAIELDPKDSRAFEWLVRVYVWRGRREDALREGHRAVALAPMSATANAELARALLANGRPDEALAQLGQLANVDPPPLRVFTLKAQCYAQKKRWSDALAELQRVGSAGGLPRGLTGYFLGRAGRRTEAAQLLDELLKRQRASGGMELDLALTYAGLGDRSQILTWITRGADARSFFPLDETTPTLFRILESFRGDSAFDRLMLRLGHQYR